MKIWTNIFRKVEVLVLTKKLINWTDFSEIDDTVAIEQLPFRFLLFWALHQEIIPFLHHHTLFKPALSPHTGLHLTHDQCASSSWFLCFLQNAVSLTLAQRRHLTDVCWMNEWVQILVNNFLPGDIWLLEKLRFLLGILHNEVNRPSVWPLHQVLCMLAPKTK